jgi:TonB family protein
MWEAIMGGPIPHLCSVGLLLALAPLVNTQTTPQPGRVRACGNVLSVTCSPERVSFTLEIAGPDVMAIDTGGIADQVSFREFAARLVLHQACVTGRLVDRSAPFKVLRVAVDAMGDIEVRDIPPSKDPFGPGVYRTCDAGLQMPTVVREVQPTYTAAALHAGVQGAVWVEGLVAVDGKIHKARVIRSLDRERGLDEEALATVGRWRLKPGQIDGKPVPTVVVIELTFTIGSK